jgi:hypothetical protein
MTVRLMCAADTEKPRTGHAGHLHNKITCALDATLGAVNLERNNIIKPFSVMAVVPMPPGPACVFEWKK